MKITPNSLAAGVGVSIKNTVFQETARTVPRKVLVLGLPLTEEGSSDPRVRHVSSYEEAAALYGQGSLLTIALRGTFEGSHGAIPIYALPQKLPEGAQAANATLTLPTLKPNTESVLSVAGKSFPFRIGDNAAGSVVDAILERPFLPITAERPEGTEKAPPAENSIVLTAKTAGAWGNGLTVTLPGLVATLEGGTGTPDIKTALKVLGESDEANREFFTDIVNAYGTESSVLDALSHYNGQGNKAVGCYGDTVHRPFRALCASTGSDLEALVAFAEGRTHDRTNGVICVPTSGSHPAEIAGKAMGIMAKINNTRPEENYIDQVLYGIDPGTSHGRWTREYTLRDRAVQAGLSPTRYKGTHVVLQNVVTFYHPSSVPPSSNGYRSMRNIAIIQNLLTNLYENFERDKWKGISIVNDVATVSDLQHRRKTRDGDAVRDDLVSLAKEFASKAWIYSPAFTIEKLKEPSSVQVRLGGDGFECLFPVVLSGEGNILSVEALFDTSIAVFL